MTASTKIANFKKLKFKAFFVVFKFKVLRQMRIPFINSTMSKLQQQITILDF